MVLVYFFVYIYYIITSINRTEGTNETESRSV